MAAFSVREAGEAAQQLPGPLFVVKAQIHAGGRGKGKFKETAAGDKGGVRLAKSRAEVQAFAEQMLGQHAGHGADRTRRPRRQPHLRRRTASTSSASSISRRWSTGPPRASPSSPAQAGGMNIEEVAARDAGEDRHRDHRPGERLHAVPRPRDRLRARASRASRSAPASSSSATSTRWCSTRT